MTWRGHDAVRQHGARSRLLSKPIGRRGVRSCGRLGGQNVALGQINQNLTIHLRGITGVLK
jgi:hypothetical protein